MIVCALFRMHIRAHFTLGRRQTYSAMRACVRARVLHRVANECHVAADRPAILKQLYTLLSQQSHALLG